ncbi:MAG: lysylphosphatidylglycerol synthase transmembrane domain-containing protein [Liquorilactobacillus ghanensis]|uniref:lysylphosphatidylglycerol synthase transmembrane domain-containing protein n=1 Tax=Liquorilactobacillus ghanensis TaxID=399370 RepID=UPI0039EBBF0F
MTNRNKLVLILMLILGVIILAFSLRDVSFRSLATDLLTLNWRWLLVAMASMLISYFLEAIVVKILLQRETMEFPLRSAVRIPLIEQLFNGITPFSSGGQPAQLFALIQSGVDAGRATSVLLMKFVVYQSMIVINFIIALFIGFHFVASKMHALSLFFLFGFLIHFAVIVGLLLVMYWYSFTRKLVGVFFKLLRCFSHSVRIDHWEMVLDEKINNFYQESLRLKRDSWLLLKIGLITLIKLLFYYIVPYFILLALGEKNVSLLLVTTFHILIVMVISLFPIPGGSGGAEYSFSTIFSSFITNSSKLVLAMLLWRLLTYYLGILLGMIALVVRPQKVKQ